MRHLLIIFAVFATLVACSPTAQAQQIDGNSVIINNMDADTASISSANFRRSGVRACGSLNPSNPTYFAGLTYVGYLCWNSSNGDIEFGYDAPGNVPINITLQVDDNTYLFTRGARADGYYKYTTNAGTNILRNATSRKFYSGNTTVVPLPLRAPDVLANNEIVFEDGAGTTLHPLEAQYSTFISSITRTSVTVGNVFVSQPSIRLILYSYHRNITLNITARGTGATKTFGTQQDINRTSFPDNEVWKVSLASSTGAALNFRAAVPTPTPIPETLAGESQITTFSLLGVEVFRVEDLFPNSPNQIAPQDGLAFLLDYQAPLDLPVDIISCYVETNLRGYTYAASGLSTAASAELTLLTAGEHEVRVRPFLSYEQDAINQNLRYYLEPPNGLGRGTIYGYIIPNPEITSAYQTAAGTTATILRTGWHYNRNTAEGDDGLWWPGAVAPYLSNGNPVLEWNLLCSQDTATGTVVYNATPLNYSPPPPVEAGVGGTRVDTFLSFRNNMWRALIQKLGDYRIIASREFLQSDGQPNSQGHALLNRMVPNYDILRDELQAAAPGAFAPVATATPRPDARDNPISFGALFSVGDNNAQELVENATSEFGIPYNLFMFVFALLPAILVGITLALTGASPKAIPIAAGTALLALIAAAGVGFLPWGWAAFSIFIVLGVCAPFVARRMGD